MVVRTRFAPSPTGSLHVGGARTALFSWLFAKRHKGEFLLRIEDTDRERSTDESVKTILEGMKWLGLEADHDPIYQTARYPRYFAAVEQLLKDDKAYRCTCSRERLDALREQQIEAKEKPRYDGHCRDKNLSADEESFVVRFRNPKEGIVAFKDHVYGEIKVENSELDDLIIVRSDGNPTYNFVVVIDDWDMEISHVIRGDDHINNTPRQINLFKALGAPIPEYAHLPMILGEDGKRLSKRHGAVSVMEFKKMGVLPHALLNYLVRLGWSHGDQEIFSVEKMTELFDLDNVSRGSSSFSYDKLFWLNQHYQKEDSPESVAKRLAWHFEQNNIDLSSGPSLEDVVKIQAQRCKTLVEMCENSAFFYEAEVEYDEAAQKKHLRPVVLSPLESLLTRFKQLSEWQADLLQACINDVCAEFDIGMGKVAQPLRVAVTGGSQSPEIDMTLQLLGRKRVLSRLEEAIKYVQNRASQ